MSKLLNVVIDEYCEIVGICLWSSEVGLKNVRDGVVGMDEGVVDMDSVVGVYGGDESSFYIDIDMLEDSECVIEFDGEEVSISNSGNKDMIEYCEGVMVDEKNYVVGEFGYGMWLDLDKLKSMDVVEGDGKVLNDMRMVFG